LYRAKILHRPQQNPAKALNAGAMGRNPTVHGGFYPQWSRNGRDVFALFCPNWSTDMFKTRTILALIAAAPLALGGATLAYADQTISDTRISNHGNPSQTGPAPYYTQQDPQPYYNQQDVVDDSKGISAHEAHPTNPGNTSNYNPPPLMVGPQPGYYMTPGAPNYMPPGDAGPNIQIISNEPYFQDDVPPYRR